MNSFGLVDRRRFGYVVAAAALLLAFIVPAIVFAAQVTERSIALSSSSKNADDVTYNVKFKAVGAAASFVVDFCSNSGVVGQACTPPVGFDASGATTGTSGYTIADAATNKVVVDSTIAIGGNVDVELAGIDNPTNAGTLYARIVTFSDPADAAAYASETPGADVEDSGSVNIQITDSIGVSGAVRESMTFCVSGANITAVSCGGVTTPTLKLTSSEGDGILTATEVAEGTVYSQISTNAVGGVVVSMKSANTCGGLKRADVTTCDIAATNTSNFLAGEAKFGVKIINGTDPNTGTNSTGTIGLETGYSASNYALNYAANNLTGVTSTYGNPIFNTSNGPANNKNMNLTFGASISNTTPAGLYSNDLSLIATGKF